MSGVVGVIGLICVLSIPRETEEGEAEKEKIKFISISKYRFKIIFDEGRVRNKAYFQNRAVDYGTSNEVNLAS